MVKPLMVLEYTAGAVKLTSEQAKVLFSDADLKAGEKRGHLVTRGQWQLPVSYSALCTSNVWDRETYPHKHGPLHVYGRRTLYDVRESGYNLEGRVKVGGKAWRGFTSSQLFELPDGALINVATIHACGACV